MKILGFFLFLSCISLFAQNAHSRVRCQAYCMATKDIVPLGSNQAVTYIDKTETVFLDGEDSKDVFNRLVSSCLGSGGARLLLDSFDYIDRPICYSRMNCAPDYGIRLAHRVGASEETSCRTLRDQNIVDASGKILPAEVQKPSKGTMK